MARPCGPGGSCPTRAPRKRSGPRTSPEQGYDWPAPRSDPLYFTERIAPLLHDGVDYVGHLDHRALAALVGSAAVAVVTPCWDEPYGLVVAEALACGTPVAGFARGALPELLDDTCGVLASPDDVPGWARAIIDAAGLERAAARRRAERHCSISTMIDRYEDLYRELATA